MFKNVSDVENENGFLRQDGMTGSTIGNAMPALH
jgi:hypothetical protein